MIDEAIAQVREILERTQPKFSDLTVGDIDPDNDWEVHLLLLAHKKRQTIPTR